MGIVSWDLEGGFNTAPLVRTPRITMLREHEEFEVETDRAGEWPVPFCSETVRRVVVK